MIDWITGCTFLVVDVILTSAKRTVLLKSGAKPFPLQVLMKYLGIGVGVIINVKDT
jgi:tetrahydromethanopterin S-methyltransferase subunit E